MDERCPLAPQGGGGFVPHVRAKTQERERVVGMSESVFASLARSMYSQSVFWVGIGWDWVCGGCEKHPSYINTRYRSASGRPS